MVEQVTNPNRALWEKGDFTRIAASMRDSGEALDDKLGINSGLRVLDLGCAMAQPRFRWPGAGPTRSASTSQPTSSPPGTRAPRPGPDQPPFSQGDASRPGRSHRTDRSISCLVFGAMFAPRPFDVASEMVRVTRPGGRIVMGNWTPGEPDPGGADPPGSAARTHCLPQGSSSARSPGVSSTMFRERRRWAGIARQRARWSTG